VTLGVTVDSGFTYATWTTVTATGIARGESTIRKMKIGNNMAFAHLPREAD
jgi:hypothetical protein